MMVQQNNVGFQKFGERKKLMLRWNVLAKDEDDCWKDQINSDVMERKMGWKWGQPTEKKAHA